MILHPKTRAEWLAARQPLITASDWAAILGWDPRHNAFDVYVSKKTVKSDDDDDDAMLLGRCFESGIARVYAEKTGRNVSDPGDFTIFVNDDIPWLGSTLDRLVWGGSQSDSAPLELKHAGYMKRYEWRNGPPLWLQIQLQAQMFCSVAPWGAYCGIVGGCEIHYGDLDRNSSFLDSALPVLEEFKWRLDNDRPPPVEDVKNFDSVKRLYTSDNGASIELDKPLTDIAIAWETAKKTKNDAEKERKILEAKIRTAMAENSVGILNDGTALIRSTTKDGKKTLRRVNKAP